MKYNYKIIIMTKCKYEDCNTRASFNFNTSTKPKYCKKHSNSTMINVVSKKCIYFEDNIQCFKQACNGVFCTKHTPNEKIIKKNKKRISQKCKFKGGCQKEPNYNYKNKTNAIYCKIFY